jgi:hypothetical protein
MKTETTYSSENSYKTEEIIGSFTDIVTHTNLLDAIAWMKSGINVKLFRLDGATWTQITG